MNLGAIYHQPKSNYCYAYGENTLHIRIRVGKSEISNIVLIYGDKFRWNAHQSTSLNYACSVGDYDYFTTSIIYEGRLAYYFKIISGNEVVYYTQWGTVTEIDESQLHYYYFLYPYIHKSEIHKVPDWVKDSVFYEIFPDRFRNGNQTNDPIGRKDWSEAPKADSVYGGDLEGIIEKLDYINNLGVNALYLTPIFSANTNHKYDTNDYFTIDSHFGNVEMLKRLVKACHKKGIRVILDGVFNHCSSKSVQFQHVLRYGKDSVYYDWFYIKKLSVKENESDYETFSTVEELPKLNTENEEVRKYLLSAIRYWMEKTNIDGWRLDVADELSDEFLREFRRTVKQCREDAYIVGESWNNASNLLSGEQMDAVMNYQLTMVCQNYFAKNSITSTQFMEMVNQIQMDYTQQVNEVNFNLLDSHDTARFLTQCKGDDRRLILALTFQMTYLGAPCIYYGTEIGLEGGEDPDCRRTFPWNQDEWSNKLYQSIRKLIQIRRSHIALRRGSFCWLKNDSSLVSYERTYGNETILILINNNENAAEFTLEVKDGGYTDLMTDESFTTRKVQKVTIQLSGFSSKIIIF